MCNLYSITTNQAAIIALFRVVNRYVGNLAPMPGVFPDYPAPVIGNTVAQVEEPGERCGAPGARRRLALTGFQTLSGGRDIHTGADAPPSHVHVSIDRGRD